MPTSEWYQAKAYHDKDIPRNSGLSLYCCMLRQ